jgi:hypothetical protein
MRRSLGPEYRNSAAPSILAGALVSGAGRVWKAAK